MCPASTCERIWIVLLSDLQIPLPLLYLIVRFAAYFFHLLPFVRQNFGNRISQAGHSLEVQSLEGCQVSNWLLWWEWHLRGLCVSYFEKVAVVYQP